MLLALVVAGVLGAVDAFASFDDSVMFDIRWGGGSRTPDAMLTAYMAAEGLDPEAGLVLESNGERFLCSLPDPSKEAQKSSPNYAGKTPRELLQSLYSARTCTYRIEMYWTYELCHGRYLMQYHEEKDQARRVKRQEYYLGQYIPEVVSEEEKDFDHMNPPKRKIDDQLLPFYPVRYEQGTVCDITNKPRVTTVHYVCVAEAKNQVYSFDEVSSCEYELVVLTPKLCSHPSFKPEESPTHEVACYPVDGAPDKPTALTLWEKEQSWDISSQFKRNNPLTKPTGKDTGPEEEEEEDEEDESADEEIKTSYKSEPVAPTPPPKPAPTDAAMTTSFLEGDYCLYGGTGWWKHEYCHGRQVLQFHEDPADRSVRTEIVLGTWDEVVHREWIAARPHKRPMKVDGMIRQASHLYTSGDNCEMTGKPREVEVRLRCRETQGNTNSVTLYLLEPKTCEYILGVESGMLCDLLQTADAQTGLFAS